MSLLSAAEVATMQATVQDVAMPDTCTIIRTITTTNAIGDRVRSDSASHTARCGWTALNYRKFGTDITDERQFLLNGVSVMFPLGTDVQQDDVLVLGGQRYRVWMLDPVSVYSIALEVTAKAEEEAAHG